MNTNAITQSGYAAESYYQAKEQKTQKEEKEQTLRETSRVTTGMTVGEPELSEKAKKYYEQLRRKYGNMDFVLVSPDKKEEAKANAGKYANANRMVVLIDTEKIERMAEDEKYREQYEGIIRSSQVQLAMAKDKLSNTPGIKTYGMEINKKGLASFFAVVDKSYASQKKRLEKRAEKKAEEKKAAKKSEEKKQAEKKKEARTEEKRTEKTKQEEDYVLVTASSVEELIQKINDVYYETRSDYVRTPQERLRGQNVNYSA